jgi:DNA-binding transcriptional ArsR family regulator
MTTAKTLLFTAEQTALANFAAALSHPARIAIVTLLQSRDRVSCGEIVEALPLAQATVSQHIKTLVAAGLLLQFPEGHKVFYQLDCSKLRNFCHSFQCTLGTQTPETK